MEVDSEDGNEHDKDGTDGNNNGENPGNITEERKDDGKPEEKDKETPKKDGKQNSNTREGAAMVDVLNAGWAVDLHAGMRAACSLPLYAETPPELGMGCAPGGFGALGTGHQSLTPLPLMGFGKPQKAATGAEDTQADVTQGHMECMANDQKTGMLWII
ncbi:hypothetical protein EJB05_22585, partial [Eragrostis curvula]